MGDKLEGKIAVITGRGSGIGLATAKRLQKIGIATGTAVDIFYVGIINVIVTSLVHSAPPLHLFDCFCSKLKSVSCALARCIGTTTTAADNITTAATIPIISKVELLLLSFILYFSLLILNKCSHRLAVAY